jgi:hypothetical protein
MFQKVRIVFELFQSTRNRTKNWNTTFCSESVLRHKRRGNSYWVPLTVQFWKISSCQFHLIRYHSLFPLGQEPILLPKFYFVAFTVSSGTMDKVHRVNGAKCDTLRSESRRILKSVDLNKGYSPSCVTYLWEMVWQRDHNVELVRTGQVLLVYRFEGCWKGALQLFCVFKIFIRMICIEWLYSSIEFSLDLFMFGWPCIFYK